MTENAPQPSGSGYSAGSAWSYGWTKFRANLGGILLAVVLLVTVLLLLNFVGYRIGRVVSCDAAELIADPDCSTLAGNLAQGAFSLLSTIISLILGAGLVRAALDICDGRELDPGRIFQPRRFWSVVLLAIVNGVLIDIGLLLCIVPGLIVAFFTQYSLYFLMDRDDLGVIDSIKASVAFTRTHFGSVVSWFLLGLVTALVGALLCGVGLIVALPIVLIGTAYTYRTLDGEPVAA